MRTQVERSSAPDALFVAAAATALFLVCWGLVHRWFWAHDQIVDWPVYKQYGDAIVHAGRVPYRDFRVEYPPGALPAFVVPSLAGDYAAAFAWLMAGCGVALVAVVTFIRRRAAFYVAVSPVLVGALILSRFDLWAALLAAAALGALAADRHRIGWALLGLAVSAKVWPAVIVPLALVWSVRRGRPRAAAAGVIAFAAVVGPFAVIAPHSLAASMWGQANRPLQIESLGAALLTTFGHPRVSTSHGSQNLVGHHAVGAASVAVQAAAVIAIWVAFARGPATRERLLRYAAAGVCAFVALGKVLSPQFLIWLVPLVPLVGGRRGALATAALTVALVLTQVWFPLHYWAYVDGFDRAGVVLARDLVLVGLLAVLLWPLAERRSIRHIATAAETRGGGS
jgi:hypothetical protein